MKKILLIPGGVMSGVFSAGVVSGLEKADAYEGIEAIYGVSAGAINAAYFLSRQSKLGSSIYYENLTRGFIHKKRLPFAIIMRVISGVIGKNIECKASNIVDIDYLFDVIANKKTLDTSKASKGSIPLFVSLLNSQTCELEWVRFNGDLEILKAAANVMPYYTGRTVFKGVSYLDGGIKDQLGIKDVMNLHPDAEIVVLLSRKPYRHKWVSELRSFIEGIFARTMYRCGFAVYSHRTNILWDSYRQMHASKRVRIIAPDESVQISQIETNKDQLLRLYEEGAMSGSKGLRS